MDKEHKSCVHISSSSKSTYERERIFYAIPMYLCTYIHFAHKPVIFMRLKYTQTVAFFLYAIAAFAEYFFLYTAALFCIVSAEARGAKL